MTEDTNGGPAMPTRTVTHVGDREVKLERVSARKGARILAELRYIGKRAPGIADKVAKFRRDYAAENTEVISRAEAELRWGPRPAIQNGQALRYPDTVTVDGVEQAHPRAGEIVMLPGELEHITEEAWAAMGHKLERPGNPSVGEAVAHVFDEALELAEDHVYRLLTLFTIPNERIVEWRKANTLAEELERETDELMDEAYADELLELAVIAGEVLEAQFVAKIRSVTEGTVGRLGNALRLVGLDPTSLGSQTGREAAQTTDQPMSSSSPATPTGTPSRLRPTSSGDTDEPTPSDGDPTPSSTRPTTSSAGSTGEPIETASG